MTFVPVIPEAYSHVLAEFESLDPLLTALRLDSSRLKCTSIAVSRKWLALGSTGGGLNLIQKDGWKQRLFLSHREGAITQIACCSHDDDYVAVATSQGLVVVWELNQERRGKPERIHVSSEHKGRKVTALCWDTAVLRVFVGDHAGKVSAIKLNTLKQAKGKVLENWKQGKRWRIWSLFLPRKICWGPAAFDLLCTPGLQDVGSEL